MKTMSDEFWDRYIASKYPKGRLSAVTKKEKAEFERLYESYMRVVNTGVWETPKSGKPVKRLRVVL